MSRTDDGDALRACPTCGTEVRHTKLGLRDYSRWLNEVLPGRVGGSDIDSVVEQNRTGRVLFMEFKPEGVSLPVGQRLLLRTMVKKGIDVWCVWEEKDGVHAQAGTMDETGEVRFVQRMTIRQLGMRVKRWWNDGLEDA